MPPAEASTNATLTFEVLGKLGSGGMGRVDLARRANDSSGRLVAVKRLHEGIASDPDFIRMFVDEARITAAIRHPNVVALVGWGVDEQGLFLATEFVRGASLRDLLRTGPLSERLAAYVCARTAAGLHAAHVRGVVHRDVSPANVLVGLGGEVKIADFGIARALASGRRTQSGVLKGKIPYMSIEQLRSEPIDARSDVCSLGIVLFEALTKSRPHGDGSEVEVMSRALTTPPPSVRSRSPSIDPELAAIVDRATSWNRDERPRDAHELERLLDAWLARRGETPAETARVLGERVGSCETGSHKRAEQIEEAAEPRGPQILDVHTNLSEMRTRAPEPEARHGVRDQMIAMLALGVVLGLLVALVVVQLAGKPAPRRHKKKPAAPLVDQATARTCTVAYACGMSHPGLGTWSQSTSVDLAACTKTVASASGPFEAPPPPPGETSDAATSSSKTTPLPASECARLANLVTAITADDARRESESAQMDTAACDLTVTCGGAAKISVQRQSRTGDGPVAKTIAALQ